MRSSLLLLISSFTLGLVLSQSVDLTPPNAQAITPRGTPEQHAESLLEQGALLLDVRTPEEFERGHLRGARNIPYDELEARRDEIAGAANTPIVVYCASGNRAGKAKVILERMEFSHIHNAGGYDELIAAMPSRAIASSSAMQN